MKKGAAAVQPLTARPVTAGSAGAWRTIHNELRTRIVSMELKPGAALIEAEIAAHHGVSRTPVREALLRLADEGLVTVFPKSGTFVARIPLRALPEAMFIRKALECMMARLATERATKSQVLSLAVCLEQQREAAGADDKDAFHRADEAFHARIADIAGHPQAWQHILQIKTQVDRFRRLTLPLPGRMLTVIGDHQAIFDGIRDRDPARAELAVGRHLDAVLPALIEAGESNTEYFTES
jgi:DNA-binding GntR family transcriptional regulator